MKRYYTERVELETETLSSLYSPEGDLIAKVMELPWKDNQPNISCIPLGIYIVEKQEPGFGRDHGYFRFRAIKGRSINEWAKDKNGNSMSSVLMHRITYVKDLQGCLGIGGKFVDLNKDGVPDMVESSKTLQWMYENMPDVFELVIRKK